MKGDAARSETLLKESLEVFRESGDSRGIAEVFLELGRVARLQGDSARALAMCRESLVLSQKLDNKAYVAFCLTALAGIKQATGDPARAVRLFGVAEVLLESSNAVLDPRGRLEYDNDLVAARLQLGKETFTKAWQEGRMLKLDQAVLEAMSNGATEPR